MRAAIACVARAFAASAAAHLLAELLPRRCRSDWCDDDGLRPLEIAELSDKQRDEGEDECLNEERGCEMHASDTAPAEGLRGCDTLSAPVNSTTALPPGFRHGSNISPHELANGRIAVSANGEPTVFLGRLVLAEHGETDLLPLDAESPRTNDDFLRAIQGTIVMGGFLQDNIAYKIVPDRRLVLPARGRGHFGVCDWPARDEDTALTCAIFGITFDELEETIAALDAATDHGSNRTAMRYVHKVRPARITSARTDWLCHVSSSYIPPDFPFVALEGQEHSKDTCLRAFFEHIAILCCGLRHDLASTDNFTQLLLRAGANRDTLLRIIAAADLQERSLGDPYAELLVRRARESDDLPVTVTPEGRVISADGSSDD